MTNSTKFTNTKIWNNLTEKFVSNCPRGKHRTRLLTTIDSSFTGDEAVSCLLKEFNPFNQQQKLTREQALQLLTMMQGKKIFHRVGAKKGQERIFKDGKTLYFFKNKTPVVQESQIDHIAEGKELNKADIWSIYSASFFARLSQLMPIDVFYSLNIRGENIQKNCEELSREDPYPAAAMKFLNYMKKTNFSRYNREILEGFFYFTKYIQSLPSILLEEESVVLLEIFEKFQRNSDELQKATSLLLLTLKPKRRHELFTLLNLITKIGKDEDSGIFRSLVLEKFCSSIVPCGKISSHQGLLIVQFLMDHLEALFQIDNELVKRVQKAKEETLTQRKTVFNAPRRSNEFRDLMNLLDDLEKEEAEVEKKPFKRVSFRRS